MLSPDQNHARWSLKSQLSFVWTRDSAGRKIALLDTMPCVHGLPLVPTGRRWSVKAANDTGDQNSLQYWRHANEWFGPSLEPNESLEPYPCRNLISNGLPNPVRACVDAHPEWRRLASTADWAKCNWSGWVFPKGRNLIVTQNLRDPRAVTSSECRHEMLIEHPWLTSGEEPQLPAHLQSSFEACYAARIEDDIINHAFRYWWVKQHGGRVILYEDMVSADSVVRDHYYQTAAAGLPFTPDQIATCYVQTFTAPNASSPGYDTHNRTRYAVLSEWRTEVQSLKLQSHATQLAITWLPPELRRAYGDGL